jgi:hypothetical protein
MSLKRAATWGDVPFGASSDVRANDVQEWTSSDTSLLVNGFMTVAGKLPGVDHFRGQRLIGLGSPSLVRACRPGRCRDKRIRRLVKAHLEEVVYYADQTKIQYKNEAGENHQRDQNTHALPSVQNAGSGAKARCKVDAYIVDGANDLRNRQAGVRASPWK